MCVFDVWLTFKKIVPKPLWVNDYFELFLLAVELAFMRLCGLHLRKHPCGDLSQMVDCCLVDLGQDGMGYFVNYTFF
jgi:hypothetical protein